MDDDHNRHRDNVIQNQELQKFRLPSVIFGFYSTPLGVLFLVINYVLPIFGYKLDIVHPVTLIYAFLGCLVWHTEFKVMLWGKRIQSTEIDYLKKEYNITVNSRSFDNYKVKERIIRGSLYLALEATSVLLVASALSRFLCKGNIASLFLAFPFLLTIISAPVIDYYWYIYHIVVLRKRSLHMIFIWMLTGKHEVWGWFVVVWFVLCIKLADIFKQGGDIFASLAFRWATIVTLVIICCLTVRSVRNKLRI